MCMYMYMYMYMHMYMYMYMCMVTHTYPNIPSLEVGMDESTAKYSVYMQVFILTGLMFLYP